jgi:uncharacterized protein (DUF2336 family)
MAFIKVSVNGFRPYWPDEIHVHAVGTRLVMSQTMQDLTTLARDRSQVGRHALFDRVAGLLTDGGEELPANVTQLIDQILTGLLHQVEADLRKQLACRLATLEAPPRDLIRALANDDIEIAEPILARSPVLSSCDLLDIIEARSTAHREVIARRARIPAEVVTALVRMKEPKVLHALLSNAGAVIPRNVFNDLVAIAEGLEQIRSPLIRREDMPKDLACQMFWYVSAALRQSILERFSVDPRELDGIMAELVAERGAARVRPLPQQPNWTSGEVRALVAKARAGDIEGFTQALAIVTGVDLGTARRIVADMGGQPLAVACKAMGADRLELSAIVVQIDKLQTGLQRPLGFLADVARTYDAMTPQRAKALLKVWSLHSTVRAA